MCETTAQFAEFSDEALVGREREVVSRLLGAARAVRTPGAAGLRAGSERVVDDGLDCAGATAAFGTATEAVIDMLGMPHHIVSAVDGIADIVVAEDVAGTNNHENAKDLW